MILCQNIVKARWFKIYYYKNYIASVRAQCTQVSEGDSGVIYVDISVIAEHDGQSGIQRVVRSLAFLLAETSQAKAGQIRFIYVKENRYCIVQLSGGIYLKTNDIIEFRAGDTFLGLDFSLDTIWRMRGQFADMKHRGVRFWYLIHDFLPITNPAWFSAPTVLRFHNWLAIVAATANGYFCVSSVTRDDLRAVMTKKFGVDERYPAHVIPMGWNLAQSCPSQGIPDGFEQLLSKLSDGPVVMMVGTVEPRKGHRVALQAMERLWAQGDAVKLVMVGGAGWKTADFIRELLNHPQLDQRLFWTGKISDEALERLYAVCTGLLFPSFAEGFGLPVVEALGHSKPVLARKLKVYAPHEGKGVSFFSESASPDMLAESIMSWLDGIARGDNIARPDLLPSWEESARYLVDRLFPTTKPGSSKEIETTPCSVR